MILKNYQLSGYKIKPFLKSLRNLNFQNKTPIKFTPRLLRFMCTFCLFFTIYSVLWFTFFILWWHYIIYALLIIPAIVSITILAHICMLPIEHMIAGSFIKKAQEKLKKINCIRIGITGSFGKTSTKNILRDMLSYKYKVCTSPQSYNTPLGLSRTVLENLEEGDDIIIFEMGARHSGDIDYLCKIYGVDYGVITSVGKQHLETFKSIAKIGDTKFELYKNSKEKTVFGRGLKDTLYARAVDRKILACEDGSFCYAKSVGCSAEGMSATIMLDGKELELKTKLLGKHNLDNIMCALALAYTLGVTIYDLKKAVLNLKPTPHRLEVIKTGKFVVIDDSYNSNEAGAKEALNVLKLFEGRKFIITPGLVEMGSEQSIANYKFGKAIAEVCDYAIVMNKENRGALLEGLWAGGFPKDKVYVKSRLEDAMAVIKQYASVNDVVLFENDLPDNFR